jgi:cytochrome c2
MLLLGLLLATFATIVGSQAAQRSPRPEIHARVTYMGGDAAIGARLFKEKGCIQCHSIKGAGGDIGPDLGKVRHNHTSVRMAAIMWNHAPLMTKIMIEKKIPRPLFKGPEMAHLIAYLHSLEVLGDPKNGKRIFERKRCNFCHAVGGVGGQIGPDLAKNHPHPPAELVGQLWNHAATMEAMMRAYGIPWPVFEEGEMADLLAYIIAAQRNNVH